LNAALLSKSGCEGTALTPARGARHLAQLVLLAATLCVPGCEGAVPGAPDVPKRPDVSDFVDASVRMELGPGGHFLLPAHPRRTPQPTISGIQARDLAIAYWESVVGSVTVPGFGGFREGIESLHGQTIDWAATMPVLDRPVVGEASYLPLPDSAPVLARTPFGPWFHQAFSSNGQIIATVSVSALATHLRVENGVVMPGNYGFTFHSVGVVANQEFPTPPWPENAARFASIQTGRLVTEAPDLLQPSQKLAPAGAVWKVRLDQSVSFRRIADATLQNSQEVFVGVWPNYREPNTTNALHSLRLLLPAIQQPGPANVDGMLIALRPGSAVHFVEVEVAQ